MQTFEEVSTPFERVGIDFIGPFVASKNCGNKYAVAFIDHFSRYVETAAVPAATAESIVNAILTKIILRHLLPKEFIVDQGRQFISNLLKTASERSKYELKFTAPPDDKWNDRKV